MHAWNIEVDRRLQSLNRSAPGFVKRRRLLLMSKVYVLATEVGRDKVQYIVFNVYRPQNGNGPDRGDVSMKRICKYIDTVVTTPKYVDHHVIIGGDFNAHSYAWCESIRSQHNVPAGRELNN